MREIYMSDGFPFAITAAIDLLAHKTGIPRDEISVRIVLPAKGKAAYEWYIGVVEDEELPRQPWLPKE